eukprot:Rmarinus@m.25693
MVDAALSPASDWTPGSMRLPSRQNGNKTCSPCASVQIGLRAMQLEFSDSPYPEPENVNGVYESPSDRAKATVSRCLFSDNTNLNVPSTPVACGGRGGKPSERSPSVVDVTHVPDAECVSETGEDGGINRESSGGMSAEEVGSTCSTEADGLDDEELARRMQLEELGNMYSSLGSFLEEAGIPEEEFHMFHPDAVNTDEMSYQELLELEEDIGKVEVGLSSQHAGRLATITATEADVSSRCTICLCDFSAGEELTKLPCTHTFHPDCVQQWFTSHHHCPLCSHDIHDDK